MIEFSLKNLFTIVLSTICITYAKCAYETVDGGDVKTVSRYPVASFNFEHVSDVYAITLWILLGSLAKVGFHLSKKLTEHFPESCLLILLGLVVGGLLYATKLAEQKAYVLNSDTFFIFLLPPIILEAGYFMPNRPFFDNIGTILLFAIVNTLFNTITIGFTLYAFNFTPLYGGTHFEMLHCLLFASLISAVDPVAVIATFVEIHVNDMLYIIVFGESLLNDAVSVVLYRLFDKFSEMGQENILGVDIVLGGASFLVVALGGVLIGIIFGVIASFTTKFTEHTPVLEPLIILTYAYLSYLTAEMFSTSGILAITFCGMFMKQYVGYNIAKKSNATIEYVLKMLASIMETIIFMFMGLSTVSDHHSWNTGFVIITIVACSLYRFIGVMIFANIANRWRLLELKLTDMLIMSYGGIRGAVAFALALILDEAKVPRKKEFVTATIAVVFFTVFIQGTTVGPIVQWLNIKRKEDEEPTMSAKLTNRLIDHVMSAFEELTGVAGKHKLRNRVRQIDRKYFKAFLLREKAIGLDQDLLTKFNQIKEMNIIKMAASNDFTSFPAVSSKNDMRNISISNFFAEGLNGVSTVPDFQILDKQPSKKAEEDAQMSHLLDTAMFNPRRRTTIHKRSQLEEETPYERRNSRLYHHQNPFPAPKNKFNQNQKRKSSAHNLPNTLVTNKLNEKQQKSEDIKLKENNNTKEESKKNNVLQTIPSQQEVPSILVENETIQPPWINSSENFEEPVRANMPTWASNPDYTVHATTTRIEDSQHVPVFDLFIPTMNNSSEQQEKADESAIERTTTTINDDVSSTASTRL